MEKSFEHDMKTVIMGGGGGRLIEVVVPSALLEEASLLHAETVALFDSVSM